METTPNNVKGVLKRLKMSEKDVAELCIKETEVMLKNNGFSDAKLWAQIGLSTLIGELGYVEDELDLEEMAMSMEGVERAVTEAFYEVFTNLQDELHDVEPHDIRDTLVYSLSNTLDKLDRTKYSRIYG